MDEEGRRLTAAIESRLGTYFPDHAVGLRLTELGSRIRPTTRLDRFAVEGLAARTVILAKTYTDARSDEPARPRLAPPVPVGSRAALEFRALSAIAAGIAPADPERLAAVPAFDLLDERTVVMGELPWPSLDRVLVRRRALGPLAGRPSDRAIVEAFRNAGSWLARFRQLPIVAEGARLATRDGVLGALATFGQHLADGTGGPTRDEVARALAAAGSILPPALAAGPGHGDFAMRNLLVDPTGRVAVVDTRARWLVPIEEDLATLLVALDTNRLQAVTRGLAWRGGILARFEDALLDGAGYDRGARARLRVYELLVVWDAWSALRARARANARAAPASRALRLLAPVAERRYAATSARLVRALGRDRAAGGS